MLKALHKKISKTMLPTLILAVVVGILAGLIVHIFNFVLEHLSQWSLQIYAFVSDNLAFLPLLILGVVLLSLFVGFTVKYIPEAAGGGIPTIEGASRGKLTLRWFLAAPAMFLASCASIFMGLSLGGEGPSMFIGGNIGYGASSLSKTREQELRVLTSAGACSGFAAAFGAPLSGIMFSVEEAHKRFSPQILLPAITSVITTTLCLRFVFGVHSYLDYSTISVTLNFANILGTSLTGVFAGSLGCLFSLTILKQVKPLDKIPTPLRILVPATLVIIAGLLIPLSIGGGKNILNDITGIQNLGFGMLIVLLSVKFVLTVMSSRSAASGGLFIPMLALGALSGAIVSMLLTRLGIPNNIVYLSLAGAGAFFAASVQAPLTAIILIFEITFFDVSSILGIVVSVGAAYMISQLLRSKPLYESLLENKLETKHQLNSNDKTTLRLTVTKACYGDGKHMEELVFPPNCVISAIARGGESLVPDGETLLLYGDILTIVCQKNTRLRVLKELKRIFN